ncbi:MAG: SDR family NAD(P)-dependent oxidoreductase [Chloroflexi bacterium]|nr:SDR family NAD(P)-dependent oxidoreductase [Chloroflexota bacterium]
MDLSDRVVLITGATGALGKAVARAGAAAGARLALTARSSTGLAELAGDLALAEERLLLQPADLSREADVAALVEAIAVRWGGVDILLNTAGGWGGGARVADLSLADWDAQLQMNLRTAFLVCRAVLPYMLERGWGRIVNVASKAAVDPGARQAAYNVAKAGVVALTCSIAQDYRRKGITANVVLPSIIDKPEARQSMPDADHSRWVKPEDIAETMLFLCGEAAAAISGASIPVYGGV